MDDFLLDGKTVKILWRDASTKVGNKPEQILMRGEVAHQEGAGLWVRGRFFVEKADTMSVRELPRDKEAEDRLYFVPWTSMDAVEIIVPGSKEFEIHTLVRTRK